MRLRNMGLGLVTAAMLAAPSAAQPAGEADIDRSYFASDLSLSNLLDDPAGAAGMVRAAGTLADCLVRAGGNSAGGLIGGPGTNDAEYARLMRGVTVTYAQCKTPRARGLHPYFVNGALAERLLLSQNRDWVPRAANVNAAQAQSFYQPQRGQSGMENVGRCAAVFSPGFVIQVLMTEAGSDAEEDALDALYAATPECGLRERPEAIPEIYQRSALAVGLWLWSNR
ncbi:hypothetical protein [Sphingomicrobium sediminis]|uniref:Uncharacterized protein n=1 Tax=Sphingomicrobium sediminis TaxID=2950949 RepID=A0A9X2EGM5_9SPHN|nr:hypothetical protein [Sphingomicrobium sediminis]MCM8557031.1 hypothetical protein [Sphingomicrobium sediminis]